MALKNLPLDHHRQFWLHHKIDPKKTIGRGSHGEGRKEGKREVMWVTMDGGRQKTNTLLTPISWHIR
jgi:hypothetical protein